MNNTYTESKKVLDKIRMDYTCAGDLIFRTAMVQVIDDGKERLNDKDLVEIWMEQLEREKNSSYWELEKAIINCAVEIAKVPTMDIIWYLHHNWMFCDYTEITYDRAIQLLQYVVGHTLQDGLTDYARDELDCYGIDDIELEFLGFGYMLDEEDE